MLLSFYPIHLLGFIIKKHSERLLLSSASFGFSDLSQIFCRLIPTLVCRVQNESAQACFTMLWDASVCHLCLTKWQHRVNGLCLCHENKRQRNKATAAREDLSVFLLKGGGGAAKGEKDSWRWSLNRCQVEHVVNARFDCEALRSIWIVSNS